MQQQVNGFEIKAKNNYASYLQGGGELGELTRNYNWSSTSIGTPDTWPPSLLNTLGTILHSKFPMFLFWGSDHICFYNDAYRPSLGNNGKHPHALGKKGEEVWPEIWKDIKPLIDSVLTENEGTWSEDQLLPIYRNGQLEDVYWTFSYSPVIGEAGKPIAVFVTCVETTADFVAKRELQEKEQKLRSVIENTPFPIGVYIGKDMIIEFANKTIIDVYGKGPNVIGKSYKEILPELENQAIFEQLDHVFSTGDGFQAKNQKVEIVENGQLKVYYFSYSFTPLKDTTGAVYGIVNTAADVTDLNIAKQKAEESEERFRTMAEGSQVLIAISDETSNATYFNKAWSEFTGRPAQQLLEFGWADLIHPDDKEQFLNTYISSFAKQLPWTGEFRMLNKDGEYRWLLAKGVVRITPNTPFAGYISSSTDITEQKEFTASLESEVTKRTKELAEANLKLQQSNIELNQFAYVASHDLQEPLRKIRTFTELVEKTLGAIPDKAKSYIDKIKHSSERMQNLINDVLRYSLLSQEKQKASEVNMNEIVQGILSDLELLIEQKEAQVHAIGLPVIEAISVQMRQLINNLISNSLKFSIPNKPVEISIKAIELSKEQVIKFPELDSSKLYYQFEFKDNGIGFNQENAVQIFSMFQRLHRKLVYEGTGIGLAMCKRIVQNHNGVIYANAVLNEGATFTFILPKHQTNLLV